LQTVSGRVDTTRTQAQRIRSETTSGRHALFGSFGEVNARSASGRIEISSDIVPESLVAHALSGRIDVTVPRDGTPTVHYSTRSGRFTTDIPIMLHGADAQFNLSTVSGRISISALN
jgi:DUF4097 and DUF4098 domain-containing protein YvlB